MKKNEPFVYDETPKQSPQSNQTWPMDKIRQSRLQHQMSSLLSPVTPKRNYINAKSLLLKCLRDSKSDPISRKRFPVSCSDDGILMDGVLVTSATAKKVTSATAKKVSDSPSSLSSLGRSARSSVVWSQHKNTEFSSPRSQSERDQDTTRSQNSSGGEGKMLADSPPCTKDANPSKLNALAEPFILTPRSSQRLASPVPVQPPPSYGHHPYFPYPRSFQGPGLFQTHYPSRSPRPTNFNQSPARNDTRISLLPTTPLFSNLNTNTSKQPVHTPTSITPTAKLSTSTTTHGSRLDFSPSVDELETVTQKSYLSSPSDELVTQTQDLWTPYAELKTPTHKQKLSPSAGLETMKTEKDWSPSVDGLETVTQKPCLLSPSDELVTMTQTQDLCSPSAELKTPTHKPEFSPSTGLETVKTEKDWSPSVDGLETVPQKPYLSSPSDELVTMTQTSGLWSPSDELKTPTHKPGFSPSTGLETMKTEKDWSPSDDGLPEFTQAQADFIKSQDRVLPDDAFKLYKFRGSRMPCFRHLCS